MKEQNRFVAWQRLTESAHAVLNVALREALDREQNFIGPEHIEAALQRKQQSSTSRRTRLERGIYQGPDGVLEVGWKIDGHQRWRRVHGDLLDARLLRHELILAARADRRPRLARAIQEAARRPSHDAFLAVASLARLCAEDFFHE